MIDWFLGMHKSLGRQADVTWQWVTFTHPSDPQGVMSASIHQQLQTHGTLNAWVDEERRKEQMKRLLRQMNEWINNRASDRVTQM